MVTVAIVVDTLLAFKGGRSLCLVIRFISNPYWKEIVMIKAIKFASIPVKDQDRALAFYTEKLGFKVFTDSPFDDKQRWIELGIPRADTKVVLFTTDAFKPLIGSF